MATIKSYTDINQSKKLAEILPLESADMVIWGRNLDAIAATDAQKFMKGLKDRKMNYIPCWSLAALLSVLPKEINIEEQRYAPCLFPVQDKWLLKLWYNSNYIITSPIAIFSDNPVDACVDMIEKLHKLNLL